MKSYSSILTTLLSLALIACGADKEKKINIPPIINKTLAEAGIGAAVQNFIIGVGPGIAIEKVTYGSVDKDDIFTAATPEVLAKTAQKYLQIGDGETAKIYHNINADAKLLLEKKTLEILYLGDQALDGTKLGANLTAVAIGLKADVTYKGKVNAKWFNSGIDSQLRYYATTSPGAQTKYTSILLTEPEMHEGTVKVVVLKDGSKATITLDGIGNSDDSEDFGWEYDGNPITSDTAKAALLASTPGAAKVAQASKIWKPKTTPVIEIASTGAISVEGSVYTSDGTGNIVDFIGNREVGGNVHVRYSISEGAIKTTSNLFSGWWINNPTNGVQAGFYSPIGGYPYRGLLSLAFVAYTASSE